jgi:hypothetical protein
MTLSTDELAAIKAHPADVTFRQVRDLVAEIERYRGLYFALAHQVVLVQRIKAMAFDGQADGHQFWEAQAALDALVGAALSWESDPDLYAKLLARQEQRRRAAETAAE